MFRTVFCALWLVLPVLAHADGTLQIEKSSVLAAHAWVDGRALGELDGKPIIESLAAGPHEVLIAADPDAKAPLCRGLIDVVDGAYSTTTLAGTHCTNLRPIEPADEPVADEIRALSLVP